MMFSCVHMLHCKLRLNVVKFAIKIDFLNFAYFILTVFIVPYKYILKNGSNYNLLNKWLLNSKTNAICVSFHQSALGVISTIHLVLS